MIIIILIILDPNTIMNFEENKEFPIWTICEEISSKKNWYSKVFDKVIVSKWRDEIPQEFHNNFDFSVKLLQGTAQGCLHLPVHCWPWNNPKICPNCLSQLKQDIRRNPESFGIANVKIFLLNEGWESQFLAYINCKHRCNWDDNVVRCSKCQHELIESIKQDPEAYDLSQNEIDDGYLEGCWEDDFEDDFKCTHPRCDCIAPDNLLTSYIEYKLIGIVTNDLHLQCQRIISDIARNEPIDYHPGSDNQVIDLIHPSMYCYVKGISKHNNGSVAPEVDESLRYQWLPSEFNVDFSGEIKVMSYINNLKQYLYPEFIPTIEKVFESFLPSLENVLQQNLRDKRLQVIVKVGQIVLTPENSIYNSSSWHTEGMPYEHIAATCIHYLDAKNITSSFLEFRKPTIVNEESSDYPQNDTLYTEHHYGTLGHHDGVMNKHMGLILCEEGASVVFPNTLQHRVKDFELKDPTLPSVRTILAFFVIDPDRKIISTADIPPQQPWAENSVNSFTKEEADFHRLRLMYHRKFFVNQLNSEIFERPFSLCEH